MIKKILAIVALILALTVGIIFVYRYQIAAYSTEKIIRSSLPPYVHIAAIRFDFKERKVFLDGFRIDAPEGFFDRYIIEIAQISCSYRMKGATILDGIEIFEPVLKSMVLHIERLQDGRVNLAGMGQVISQPHRTSAPNVTEDSGRQGGGEKRHSPKFSDFIKLPQRFSIKQGKIIFTDRFFVKGQHTISFENMDADVNLQMNDAYTQVLRVSSTGQGDVDGRPEQVIQWTISLDPNAPRLTMSNRFEVSNVDLITFEPYYDRFSPFEFARARVSGLLIFDFDNGNIGSSNELHLHDLVFSVKPGYENTMAFETDVKNLAKYFTTSTGEVIFDFKIKGDMANPQFYLGPISKQAMAAMVIDKVSEAIKTMADKSGQGQGSGSSDMDKAMKAMQMFKGFLDKKS
jgi:hypothetical protein